MDDKALLELAAKAAGIGTCDCWVQCPCGWAKWRGEECRNPKCSQGTKITPTRYDAHPHSGEKWTGHNVKVTGGAQ